jgi:hypothetical protein
VSPFARPTRRERRLLIVTGVAAAGAGLIVALLIVVTGSSSTPKEYRPFRVGHIDRVTDGIRTGGPVCFPDPRRGTRGFCIDRVDGNLQALHVLVPGEDHCAVVLDRARKRLLDCRRHPIDPRTLRRFPLEVRDKIVYVDLRRFDPPLTPTSRGPGA